VPSRPAGSARTGLSRMPIWLAATRMVTAKRLSDPLTLSANA
jgi:hypothetical protein